MASHFAPQDNGSIRRKEFERASVGHSRSDVSYYTSGGGRGHGSGRGKKVGIVIGIVLAVLLVVGGTCGVLLYRSAVTVRAQASELMAQVDPLKEAVKSGDAAALDDAVGTVQENMAAINAEVHSPLWTLASFVPVVGEDVCSVQSLGEAGQALVDQALVPITNSLAGTGLSDLFQDGVVNVELIQTISDAVSGSLPTIRSSVDTIANLPEAHIPQLAEVLDRVQGPVSEMQGLVDQVEPVLDLLPQMLGADGARTYLVIAQNNSEVRSTGGLPGSWGTVSIDNGVISMGEFHSILAGGVYDVPVTEEEQAYLGWTLGTDGAQMTYTPNFVRVGELAQQYWIQAGNESVDGVIAIDPVFLQRILGLTGGFTSSDGTAVDGSNAAWILLSNTYWRYGNNIEETDDYFTSVASQAFDTVMNNLGSVDFTALLDVLEQSGADGRLCAWMDNDDEESLMSALGFAGEMGSDPTSPQLGVYFNDATWSKISWYLSGYTQIGEGVINGDGSVSYAVTTTITNTMTADEAATAPSYITGYNPLKRDTADMLTYVYFFAPAGGSISDITTEGSGHISGFTNASVYGLQMDYALTNLNPGESVVVSYTVTTSSEAAQPLTLRTTPLAQESLMQAPTA